MDHSHLSKCVEAQSVMLGVKFCAYQCLDVLCERSVCNGNWVRTQPPQPMFVSATDLARASLNTMEFIYRK